jgi:hypothetical protein
MAQVVKHLPSKAKVLSSIPTYTHTHTHTHTHTMKRQITGWEKHKSHICKSLVSRIYKRLIIQQKEGK